MISKQVVDLGSLRSQLLELQPVLYPPELSQVSIQTTLYSCLLLFILRLLLPCNTWENWSFWIVDKCNYFSIQRTFDWQDDWEVYPQETSSTVVELEHYVVRILSPKSFKLATNISSWISCLDRRSHHYRKLDFAESSRIIIPQLCRRRYCIGRVPSAVLLALVTSVEEVAIGFNRWGARKMINIEWISGQGLGVIRMVSQSL